MSIFKKRKLPKLDAKKLPLHVAFIIDGNGRWAKKRGLPRTVGHSYGVQAVADTIQNCIDVGIKFVSFYTFSTENWKRPKEEIDAIFALLRDYLKKDLKTYKEQQVRLITSGDLSKLPADIVGELENIKHETKYFDNITVNLAINYGGQDEIVWAINKIIAQGVKEVTKDSFKNFLYTKDLPDPDLIVRTSGEIRTSNFMPYQGAYSEWYFTKTFWPSFDRAELEKALLDYQARNRRFGGLKKEEK